MTASSDRDATLPRLDGLRAESELAAARVAEFERTRNPEVLWPGVREQDRVAAARELERVARVVLGGSSAALDPEGAHHPRTLSVAAHTVGVGPLFGRWVEDGRLAAREEIKTYLSNHLAHARARSQRLAEALGPVIDALAARGVQPVALKGVHTAYEFFEEPAVRRMADADLLVGTEQVAAAESALLGVGFLPSGRARKPYKRDWTLPGARLHSTEFTHERDHWTIELHVSLDRTMHPGAVARLDSELAGVVPFSLFGRPVYVLTLPALLVQLAAHCSQELDSSRLLKVIELVRVARRIGAPRTPRWDEVLAVLARTRAARFTYPALALAEDLAPDTIDPRVLDSGYRASTRAARHTVRRLAPAGGSLDARGALRQAMWVAGPTAVAQRLLRAFWPASFTDAAGTVPGWRNRLRRIRSGALSWRAPDERDAGRQSPP